MRSDSEGERPFLNRQRSSFPALLVIAAVAAPFFLGSCVISGTDGLCTSIVVRFDDDGLTAVISLGRPVSLPLDEDDAYYIMNQCSCACRGDLVRVHDYWQYPEYPDSYGCFIRIHVYTGDVECFSDL
ncbi:MAG TPA: hypothetical protein PLT09_03670 [Deltaproteobacteria bacterium]|nr:hypothetical protein [Deltaproteobacteria bacterium]HPR54863.1 hypothetical protein [Deltaproteobacteria bacterium]HXK46512.1 hypothetical protein [Deltaproteobacteria bacterium]